MPQLPSPLRGHPPEYFVESGKILVGITCMLLVLCIAAVGGRLAARRMSMVGLERDDYVVLIALVNTAVQCDEQKLTT